MNKYLKEIYVAVLKDGCDIKIVGDFNGSYTIALSPRPNSKYTGLNVLYVLTENGIAKPTYSRYNG